MYICIKGNLTFHWLLISSYILNTTDCVLFYCIHAVVIIPGASDRNHKALDQHHKKSGLFWFVSKYKLGYLCFGTNLINRDRK